ncbi:MAG: hypothetical protein LIP09_05335 [Bacteroidales bacterium]|nr:hypothetical protein [Bacteroidales bacterium]
MKSQFQVIYFKGNKGMTQAESNFDPSLSKSNSSLRNELFGGSFIEKTRTYNFNCKNND